MNALRSHVVVADSVRYHTFSRSFRKMSIPAQLRQPLQRLSTSGVGRASLKKKTTIAAMNAQAVEHESRPLASSPLGEMFVKSLPGWLFYSPSLIMPVVSIFAASFAAALGPPTLTAAFASLATVWYAFVVMPGLDFILGDELRNQTPDEIIETTAADSAYRAFLHTYVGVHCAALVGACHLLCTHSVHPLAFVGAALSCGVMNGLGFTAAHEMLHSLRPLDKFLTNCLLACFGYMHWEKSHLMHHIKVATPEDPSSSRKGETLYSFIPRSVVGNLVDGYAAEAARRQAKGIPFWSLQNRALRWVACPLGLAGAAFAVYGWAGVAFYALQAFFGVLMLETVNYLEHYGLERKELPDGRYERAGTQHSWNASTLWTNAISFRLQRHSDHHTNATVPYQLLRSVENAPQLPAGYPLMMVISLVPPLFFSIMDPRVEEAQRLQETLVATAQ